MKHTKEVNQLIQSTMDVMVNYTKENPMSEGQKVGLGLRYKVELDWDDKVKTTMKYGIITPYHDPTEWWDVSFNSLITEKEMN